MNCRIRSITIVFLFLFNAAFAQHNVSGKVSGADNSPVSTASVALLKAGGNELAKSAITDEAGAFLLEGISDGTYVLKVTSLGYVPYSSDNITVQGANVQLPPISLQPK